MDRVPGIVLFMVWFYSNYVCFCALWNRNPLTYERGSSFEDPDRLLGMAPFVSQPARWATFWITLTIAAIGWGIALTHRR